MVTEGRLQNNFDLAYIVPASAFYALVASTRLS
jgi:hypothetical protein